MVILDRIIADAAAIKTALKNIKTAANNKGANITANDALSTWKDRINAISEARFRGWYDESGALYRATIADNVQVVRQTTEPIIFEPTMALLVSLGGAKKITFSGGYTQFLTPTQTSDEKVGCTTANTLFKTEELEFLDDISAFYFRKGYGTDRNYQSFGSMFSYIKKISAPNATGSFSGYLDTYLIANQPDTLLLDLPKITTLDIYEIGRTGSPITLTINAPLCTVFGTDSVQETIRFIKGSWTLPACTTIKYLKIPEQESTLKVPALTEITNSSCFNIGSSSGLLHLYIGANLATAANSSVMATQVGYSHLDIHIPAGESTTKTLLDNAGITYTQDYVIGE